jgi:hypothetical protein
MHLTNRDDPDIVEAAIRSNAQSYKSISRRLKTDLKIVRLALERDVMVFGLLHPDIQKKKPSLN